MQKPKRRRRRAGRHHHQRAVRVLRRKGGRYTSRRGGLVLYQTPRRVRRVRRVRLGRREGALILRRNPMNARGLWGLFKVGFVAFFGVAAARAIGYWYDQKAASYVKGADTTVTWRQWLNIGVRAGAQGLAIFLGQQMLRRVSQPYSTVFAVGGYGETVRQAIGAVYTQAGGTGNANAVGLGRLPNGRTVVKAWTTPSGQRMAMDDQGQWYELTAPTGMAGVPMQRGNFRQHAQQYLEGVPVHRTSFRRDAGAYLETMGYRGSALR